MDIYYFSGTGNSLYVAKSLQERFSQARLIPIVGLLNRERLLISADTVGVIFPIHRTTIPLPVKEFLQRLDGPAPAYMFVIATRNGTTHRAFRDMDTILKPKGGRLDASFTINMANNDPKFKGWTPPDRAKLDTLESAMQKRLDSIQHMLIRQEAQWEKDTSYTIRIPAIFLRIMPSIMRLMDRFGLREQFYADSKCTGCGCCEQVCPSTTIRLLEKQPVWQESIPCYSCYACLSYCPVRAIQIKTTQTANNGRYSHPAVTRDDIAQQKHDE